MEQPENWDRDGWQLRLGVTDEPQLVINQHSRYGYLLHLPDCSYIAGRNSDEMANTRIGDRSVLAILWQAEKWRPASEPTPVGFCQRCLIDRETP
jgi:hypothetical protein